MNKNGHADKWINKCSLRQKPVSCLCRCTLEMRRVVSGRAFNIKTCKTHQKDERKKIWIEELIWWWHWFSMHFRTLRVLTHQTLNTPRLAPSDILPAPHRGAGWIQAWQQQRYLHLKLCITWIVRHWSQVAISPIWGRGKGGGDATAVSTQGSCHILQVHHSSATSQKWCGSHPTTNTASWHHGPNTRADLVTPNKCSRRLSRKAENTVDFGCENHNRKPAFEAVCVYEISPALQASS